MNEIPTILSEALEIATASAREEYLRLSCGDDLELRRRVNQLLEDYEAAGDFLEEPVTADFFVPEILEGPGTQIGPYKLREQIGEGGMGVVYLAEQLEPIKRRVALKLVKSGMDTRQVLARFEAERQALAMMSHPHISRILDAGATESGRPYFVMELVRGIPITEFCNQWKLSVRQRLELFLQVCQAVQHAHQRGIIHRDLKPSNILVELHDVIPVPKVIDFGIAKATGQQLSEHTVYTKFVQMLGTPLYMSPEQATLSGLDIDTRSDIYSLGVVLYELLTGSTPFDQTALTQEGPDEMRRIIREVDPPRPSQKISTLQAAQLQTVSDQRQVDPRTLSGSISRELDWVVLQAMEKDRERRYESASAMAADLQRYLNNEAVLACPPSWGYQIRKFASRNKVAIVTATIVTLSLLVGTAVATWQAIIANQERNRANQAAAKYLEESRVANQERLRAESAEQAHRQQTELAENSLYASAIRMAYRHKKSGDDEQAAQLLDTWIPRPGIPDRRGVEWYLLKRQLQSPGTDLMRLPGDVSCIRVSPDGSSLVAATNQGVVQRRRLSDKSVLPSWESGLVDVRRMEFSPDGKYLALISYDAVAVLIETATGQVRLRCPVPEKSTKNADVCFVDGRLLTSGNGGLISIWNLDEFRLERIWDTKTPLVLDMATSPASAGLYLAVDNPDITIRSKIYRVPKLEDGQFDLELPLPFNTCALAVIPNGQQLAVGDNEGEIFLWDFGRNDWRAKWKLTEKINELNFSPDGVYLAAAERSGVVHVWDWSKSQGAAEIPSGEHHRHWQAHPRPARTVVFSPDSRSLLSSGVDGRVIEWAQWHQPQTHQAFHIGPELRELRILRGNRTIAVTDPFSLRTIKADSGLIQQQIPFSTEAGFGNILVSDPDGQWLACAGSSRPIYCGQLLPELTLMQIPDSQPRAKRHDSLTFLSDHRTLLAVETLSDFRVRGWDVGTRQLSFHYDKPALANAYCAVCPSRDEIFVMTNQQFVRINVRTGQEIDSWRYDGLDVYSIACNHPGTMLAIGRKDRTVHLLDPQTGQHIRSILGFLSPPRSIRFSADGKTVITRDDRGVIQFWQVASGSELLTWPTEHEIDRFDLAPDDSKFGILYGDTVELFDASRAADGP
ncbi:MAG: WD40 repeat domain-containing serine/threonine protein kinase [Planctomycetaceae bacterium]